MTHPSWFTDRFLPKIDKRPDGCWHWTASTRPQGYGWFGLPRRGGAAAAHRVAYVVLVGPIPTGMVLDHLCRVPSCVNPAHLEPVTNAVNVLRGLGVTAVNARKTHCLRGHALTPDNVYVHSTRGGRQCRACNLARPAVIR